MDYCGGMCGWIFYGWSHSYPGYALAKLRLGKKRQRDQPSSSAQVMAGEDGTTLRLAFQCLSNNGHNAVRYSTYA